MVKVSLVLDKRYRFKDDLYLIKVKIYRNKEAMYISTGYKVHENEWNKDSRKIVLRRDKSSLNLRLADLYGNILHKLHKLQEDGRLKLYTNKKLYDYLTDKSEDEKTLFKVQFNAYVDSLNSKRTKEIYLSTWKHIASFCDIDTLSLTDIDIPWLTKFSHYIKKEGCKSINTIAIHLRNIRAVINYARKLGIISQYVFDNFHIEREETEKRALTIEEVRKLLHAELPQRQSMYRDIFFLIIYLMGINIIDLSRLTDIVDGRISYRRAKTGTLYSIKVEPEALEIINRYRGEHHLLNAFDRYKNYKGVLSMSLKMIHSADSFRLF